MPTTPRSRIEAECARRGLDAFVAGCVGLLAGRDADPGLVAVLGGAHARHPGQEHWHPVWAARGLLWAWDDAALPAIRTALCDDAWRVREMAAKVVARHRLGDALEDVARLRGDPVPRVRAAAERAVVRIAASGA